MYSFRFEPEPAEREALEAALTRLLGSEERVPEAYGSEWRRAALEEGISQGDEDEPGP
jgi:hypothetical protein